MMMSGTLLDTLHRVLVATLVAVLPCQCYYLHILDEETEVSEIN